MNKTELIAAMAETSGLSKKDCDAALAAFITTVSLVRGLRPVRAARSLTSKEPKPISCTFSPDFKAGQAFKDAIR